MITNSVIIVGQLEAGIGRHVKNYCEYVDPSAQIYTDLRHSDKQLIKELRLIGVNIKNLSVVKKPSILDLKNLYTLIKTLRKKEVDIVIGHGAKGGIYARCLRVLKCCKRAYYVPHGGVLHYNFNTFLGVVYLSIEKILYYFTYKILFESSYSKLNYFQKVKKIKQCRYEMLHSCIEMEKIRIDYNRDNEKLKLCCVAQLRQLKGIDLLLKALTEAKLPLNSYICDIYGGGTPEETQHYKKYVVEAGLEEVIKFRGVQDVFSVYCEYDLYIQPSRFESFGLAALEAYYAGCDLLLSNTGGLLENFKGADDVVYFENGSFKSLKEAIEDYAPNPVRKSRKDFFKNYTPGRFKETYIAALQHE